MSRAQSTNWSTLALACLERCATCSNCRHVSISLHEQECGWFTDCDYMTNGTRRVVKSRGTGAAEALERAQRSWLSGPHRLFSQLTAIRQHFASSGSTPK